MSKKLLITLTVVMALLILGLSGWWYYENNKNVSSWKPFQNQYYSIKTPPDWKEETNNIGAGLDKRIAGYTYGDYINLNCVTMRFEDCDLTGPSHVNVEIFVYNNNGHLSATEYNKKKYNIDYEVVSKTEGGVEGINLVALYGGKEDKSRYVFTNYNYAFEITIDYFASKAAVGKDYKNVEHAYEEIEKNYQPILKKIINSFLPQDKFEKTANWQTYRNEKYSYEFKYPEDKVIIFEGANERDVPPPTSQSESLTIADGSRQAILSGIYPFIFIDTFHNLFELAPPFSNNVKNLEDVFNNPEVVGFHNVKSKNNILISGKKAIEITTSGINQPYKTLIIDMDRYFIEIKFDQTVTLDDIYSTFKLIK